MLDPLTGTLGNVSIIATHGRGMTPEEVADLALRRIVSVGETAPPPIAEQAAAFRENIRRVLVYYMEKAVNEHRVTLVAKFHEAGYPELVKLLDK